MYTKIVKGAEAHGSQNGLKESIVNHCGRSLIVSISCLGGPSCFGPISTLFSEGFQREDVPFCFDYSADSRWVFNRYCFGLFDLGMGILVRFFLVFVVSFFVSSVVLEVMR